MLHVKLTVHLPFQVLPTNVTIGEQVLRNLGLNFSDYFYWVSIGALIGFWMVFNIAFTCALSYMKCKRHIFALHLLETEKNVKCGLILGLLNMLKYDFLQLCIDLGRSFLMKGSLV